MMQYLYLNHAVILLLFIFGLILMTLVIARYVPQLQLIKRIAIPREQIESSSIPLWARMVVIPLLASILSIILPLSYVLVSPESLSIIMDTFSMIPYGVLFIVLASSLGYYWRHNLSYYSESKSESDAGQ